MLLATCDAFRAAVLCLAGVDFTEASRVFDMNIVVIETSRYITSKAVGNRVNVG